MAMMGADREFAPTDVVGRSVSVIVPLYGSGGDIWEQLAALETQDFAGEWELILSDNGVDDDIRLELQAYADGRRDTSFVDARRVPGASHARNVGAAVARGSLLLYCDADDVVSPWWIRALVAASAEGPFVGGVDIPLDAADGTWETYRHRSQEKPFPAIEGGPFVHLPWARGGNCAIAAELLREVGGWSESWLRGQDVELSWRIQHRGTALLRAPAALAFYRRPDTLRAVVAHQFEFGARAPYLYRAFGPGRTLRRSARGFARDAWWLFSRSPFLVLSRRRRRKWLIMAAGVAGRIVGAVRLGVGVPVEKASDPYGWRHRAIE